VTTDDLMAAIRSLGDGPEPAPTEKLAAFLAGRAAGGTPPPAAGGTQRTAQAS
jgi:hypothetical protein